MMPSPSAWQVTIVEERRRRDALLVFEFMYDHCRVLGYMIDDCLRFIRSVPSLSNMIYVQTERSWRSKLAEKALTIISVCVSSGVREHIK